MKLVKCVRAYMSGIPPQLSDGSVYQVEKETDTRYFLVGNSNAGSGWNKDRFEPVSDIENEQILPVETTSETTELTFDYDAYNGLKPGPVWIKPPSKPISPKQDPSDKGKQCHIHFTEDCECRRTGSGHEYGQF